MIKKFAIGNTTDPEKLKEFDRDYKPNPQLREDHTKTYFDSRGSQCYGRSNDNYENYAMNLRVSGVTTRNN